MKTNSAGRHNLLRYDMLWLGGGSHRFNVFKFGTLSQTGTLKKKHMTYTFQTTCFFLSHFLLSKPPLKGEKNSQVAVSHTKLDVALKPNASKNFHTDGIRGVWRISKISDLFAKTTKGSWSKHTYVYIYIPGSHVQIYQYIQPMESTDMKNCQMTRLFWFGISAGYCFARLTFNK